MKDTIVVNLFAGPGAGKSTGAAYIFSKLKMRGVDAELVTEFAKDKVWEGNDEVFKCQFYLSGKQAFKISRCCGKVDVIVTDSPIAIGTQYCNSEKLNDAILEEFNSHNNFNFFIKRTKEYNPNGRNQTEEEAKQVDENTKKWLEKNSIEYISVNGDLDGFDEIVYQIFKKLNSNK